MNVRRQGLQLIVSAIQSDYLTVHTGVHDAQKRGIEADCFSDSESARPRFGWNSAPARVLSLSIWKWAHKLLTAHIRQEPSL